MKNQVVLLVTSLAIMANLLVPQRLLVYPACCYDAQGHLLARSEMCCGREDAKERVSGPDCCAPTEYELRPTPPAVSLIPDTDLPLSSGHVAMPLPADAPMTLVAALPLVSSLWKTGPPGYDGLLALQSRLNL